MATEDVMSWSAIAINNGAADGGINWIEHMPRATVNNSARSMMAAIAKNRNLQSGVITTTVAGGNPNAQVITTEIGYTAFPTGLRILVKNGASNTGPMTLNLDGIGEAVVRNLHNHDLSGGEVVVNGYSEYIYNGATWILLATPGTPRFVAERTTAQIPNDGVWTKVLLNSESTDTDGTFDTVNGGFFPSVKGFYYLTAQLAISSDTQAGVSIYVDGSSQVVSSVVSTTSVLNTSHLANLNIGDFVELYGFASGPARSLLSARLSGFRLLP